MKALGFMASERKICKGFPI